MGDELSRRQLVRQAALAVCAPTVARALAGCARRIDPERVISTQSAVDGRITVARADVPELDQAGGAVVLHAPCPPRPVLLVNTGAAFIALQAECPHAGCELAWVAEDRQAECPCHLSRFAGDGTVLHGPAQTNLESYPVTEEGETVVVHLAAGDGVFPPVQGGRVVFNLANYPALQQPGGVVLGHPDGLFEPLLVTRPDASRVVALSATCTHQQCTVLPAGGVLHCPCHGSQFDLVGQVRSSPATVSLPSYPVTLDPSGTVTIAVGSSCP